MCAKQKRGVYAGLLFENDNGSLALCEPAYPKNERSKQNMARRFSSNRSGGGINVIMGVVIAAVLVLAVVAVWGPIKENYRTNSINSGTANYNAGEIADQMGMEFEDFLNYYDLTAEDGITEKSDVNEVADKMTLENMSQFYWGVELTDEVFAEFKADQGIGEDVAKDTKDADVKDKYNQYQSAKQAEAAASEAPAEDTAADDAAAADVSGDTAAETGETTDTGAEEAEAAATEAAAE